MGQYNAGNGYSHKSHRPSREMKSSKLSWSKRNDGKERDPPARKDHRHD